MNSPADGSQVIGLLLAGGQARRMGGGDKCLRTLAGQTLLELAIRNLQPQVSRLVLSANGDPGRFAGFGLPVVPDVIEGFAGPLAGVLSGMEWARTNAPEVQWIVTCPTDAPFLPPDLVSRMMAAVVGEGAQMACAASGGRSHPVAGLWPVALAHDLRAAMEQENMRKIDLWTARYPLATVEWVIDPVDPFFNVNRRENLEQAERMLV